MTRRDKPARVALDVRSLIGHEELFRISGSVERDTAIDAWLAGEPAELKAIARAWFTQMRDCGDDVRETMHDGCPVACVGDAPFAYVDTFTGHVNVGFFQGAALDDPAGLLQGTGKRMRHVKLKPGAAFAADALADLVRAAHADIRRRLQPPSISAV